MFQVELDTELKKLLKAHMCGSTYQSQNPLRSTGTSDPLLLHQGTSGTQRGLIELMTRSLVTRMPGYGSKLASTDEAESVHASSDVASRTNSGVLLPSSAIPSTQVCGNFDRSPPKTIVDWRGNDEQVVQIRGPDKFMMSSECQEILLRKIHQKQRKANSN